MTANRRTWFAVVFAVLLTTSMGALGIYAPAAGSSQVDEPRAAGLQAVDLNLTATGPSAVEPGQNVTVNFTLTNGGEAAGDAAAIELVSVPRGWAVVNESSPADVRWSEARMAWVGTESLEPGERVSTSVTFQTTDDSATTEYYVSARASDAANNTADAFTALRVGEPDSDALELETSVGDSAAAGENVTMDVTLTNRGEGDAVAPSIGLVLPRGWEVVDETSPANATFSAANGAWVGTDALAAGESLTVSVVLSSANDSTAGEYFVSVRGSDAENRSVTTAAQIAVTEVEPTEPAATETETETETTEVETETTVAETETTETTETETTETTETTTETTETETEAETTETETETETTEDETDAETTEAETETTETETETEIEARDDSENVSATFYVDDEPAANVTLEVADSPEERAEGLMFRESLPENHGMVFVYEDAAPRSFWMKNTLLPLDMIFIAENGTVLNVEHADPEPNASDEELTRYQSDGPAKYVIELEQGFANRTGVEAGAEVEFDVEGSLEPANETAANGTDKS
ncbi:hypothetical protein BRC82_05590 [Halobacteriales archaeon QS_1_67_19]|nr:MAG: hypothetical protein BRC82_05590 [Halobacteriales archaeon QS_1_67_19]